MSSFTPSTDSQPTMGRRKRPMRMRVKKYDVDASNSFITIDMAGRVENNAQNHRNRYVDTTFSFSYPTGSEIDNSPITSADLAVIPPPPSLPAESEFGQIINDEGDGNNSLRMFAKVIETGNQEGEDEDSLHGAPSLSASSASDSLQSPHSPLSPATENDEEDDEVCMAAASVLAKYATSETSTFHQKTPSSSLPKASFTYKHPKSSHQRENDSKGDSESSKCRQRPSSSRPVDSSASIDDKLDNPGTKVEKSDQKQFLEKYQSIYNPQAQRAPSNDNAESRRAGQDVKTTTFYGNTANVSRNFSDKDNKDMKNKSQLERNIINDYRVDDETKMSGTSGLPGNDDDEDIIFHDAVSLQEEETKQLNVNDLVKLFGTVDVKEREHDTMRDQKSDVGSHSSSSDLEGNEGIGGSSEDTNEEFHDSQTTTSIYRERGLEHDIYPTTSDTQFAIGSSESISRASSETTENEVISEGGGGSKKWWARMGSLFQRCRARPESSPPPSVEGGGEFDDKEIMDEEGGTIGGDGFHSQIVETDIDGDAASEGDSEENEDRSQYNHQLEILPKVEESSTINSQALLIGFNKLKPAGERKKRVDMKEQVDTIAKSSGKNVSFVEAAAALARSKQQKSLPYSSENYDTLYKPKIESKKPSGSIADQVAALALAKKNNNPQLQSSEDYDTLYKPKIESKKPSGSIADQVAALALARKNNNPQLQSAEDYNTLYKPKAEAKKPSGSIADQVAALALARKNNNSQLQSAEDYDKLYKPKTGANIPSGSIADQVAALALARKNNNPQLQSAEDYDKLYKPKTEAKVSGGSLADQVAAASMAVRMKNGSAPKTAEEYDELYKPKMKTKTSGRTISDQAAALALARKKNNSQFDYNNLYHGPRKEIEEPKRMIDLKPVGKEKSHGMDIDSHDHTENSEDIESEDILCSSSMTDRDLHEHTVNSTENESEENLCSSYSASNSYSDRGPEENYEDSHSSMRSSRSLSTENPVDKRTFWYWFSACLVVLIIVIVTPLLIHFLGSADNGNGNHSKIPPGQHNSSYEPTRSPTVFQPSLPTVEPSFSSIQIQSPVPSITIQTDHPTLYPSDVPTILNPTFQPIFPIATPSSVITDPSKFPVSNGPSLRPTRLPSQSHQSMPSNQPSIIVSTLIPTEKSPSSVTPMPASTLRQFLISQWLPLEESLNEPFSPQSEALEWLLVSNIDIDTYSQEQLMQRFAMATFFISTNGYNWSNNDGWLSEQNECFWYQTKNYRDPCDTSGRLVNLELDGNGVSGSLPPELALLSNSLTRLDLAKNVRGDNSKDKFLQGTLPSEIGLLTTLKYMSLRKQQMTGRIPDEVGKLSLLTVLDLESNKFEGPLMAKIGEFQKLNNLYLGSNRLSGALSSDFGRLQFLVNLDLSGNRFSSTLPSELGKLSYLQSLSLGNNRITGTIPTFLGQLSNLQGTLDLSNNLLEGTIPTDLGQLSLILTVLDLSSNQLSGPIPAELDRLVSLGNLQLQNNLLTGTLPPSFFKLSHLQFLQFENNNLTGDVPKSVCDALVTNKIQNNYSPTYLIADCVFKVTCECCQYCCSENGCECQFGNTGKEFLCKYGDVLSSGFRMVNLNPRSPKA